MQSSDQTIRGVNIGSATRRYGGFRRDPQHPSTTANVAARLGNDPAITIPDATEADVLTAASACDDLVLPAGAGFFCNCLNTRARRYAGGDRGGWAVFVCGSLTAGTRPIQPMRNARHSGMRMPAELFGQSEHRQRCMRGCDQPV